MSDARLRIRGAAFTTGGATVVAGPSGSGKTGVLLAAVAEGARPVAAEEVEVDDGAVRPIVTPLRIRGRHVRHAPWILRRLGRAERARLRVGAVAARAPIAGVRLGRRVFVDVDLSCLGSAATTPAPLDVVAVLVPSLQPRGEASWVSAAEAAPLLAPHVDGPLAGLGGARVLVVERGRDDDDRDLARRVLAHVVT